MRRPSTRSKELSDAEAGAAGGALWVVVETRQTSGADAASDEAAPGWSLPTQGIPQTIGHEVEGQHRQHDGDPGEDDRPRRRVDELESLLEHAAPARSGRLLTDAEKAQTGLGQQRESEGKGELDDDGRRDVGQHVTTEQPFRGRAEAAGRLDIGLLPDRDHLAPEQSHETRHEHDGNRDRSVVGVSTQQRRHGQGEDQRRKREESIHRAHDHRIDGTPEEAGDQTEGNGNESGETHDLERHAQGDASTPDEAAQDVAPEVIRSEPVRERRPGVDGVDVLDVGRVGRDQGREDRGENDDQEEDQARDGQTLMQEPRPEPRTPFGQIVGAVPRLGNGSESHERVAGAGRAPCAHDADLTPA